MRRMWRRMTAAWGYRSVGLAVVSASVLSSVSSAETVDLTGTVLKHDGNPAVGYDVSLARRDVSATTDSEGAFHLHGTVVGILESRRPSARTTGGSDILVRPGLLNRRGLPSLRPLRSVFDGRGRIAVNSRGGARTATQRYAAGFYVAAAGTAPGAAGDAPRAFLAKAMDDVDTLIIAHEGAELKRTPLSSLEGDLGEIHLSDPDIVTHRMVLASYGSGKAYIIAGDGSVEWEYGPTEGGYCQDAWMLANGNVLMCNSWGYVQEVTMDKDIVWEYHAEQPTEIHSCQPLPGGGVLVGDAGAGKILEFTSDGEIARSVNIPNGKAGHSANRQVRKTCDSTYLVCSPANDNTIYELDFDGAILREITKNDLDDVNLSAVHSAVKLPNGNIIIGTGYITVVAEVDRENNVVWKLTKQDVPEDFDWSFTGGVHRLPNGNTVIACYHSTPKVFEVTPEKEVVFSWSGEEVSKPTHVYVCDDAGDPAMGEVYR